MPPDNFGRITRRGLLAFAAAGVLAIDDADARKRRKKRRKRPRKSFAARSTCITFKALCRRPIATCWAAFWT